MAVAALRPDRADRALCRGEFRAPAEAVPVVPVGLGVPQREAGAGAVSPVHAVRRRYDRHAGRGVAADAEMAMMMADVMEALGHRARRLCDPREQPQGAGWRAGGDRARRGRERRASADGAAGDRQAGQARAVKACGCFWAPGVGRLARKARGFYKRCGIGSDSSQTAVSCSMLLTSSQFSRGGRTANRRVIPAYPNGEVNSTVGYPRTSLAIRRA